MVSSRPLNLRWIARTLPMETSKRSCPIHLADCPARTVFVTGFDTERLIAQQGLAGKLQQHAAEGQGIFFDTHWLWSFRFRVSSFGFRVRDPKLSSDSGIRAYRNNN